MVRTVHMNNFYETSLQISDPKIEFLTNTHFLKKWPCPKFWEMLFLAEKSPCGVPPQQNKGFQHTISINVAFTVPKGTIIKFIFGLSGDFRPNKFYNRDLLDRTGHIYWNIMFKTFVLLWRHPAGAFFPPNTTFPEILNMAIFKKTVFVENLIFGSLILRHFS